jgi:hypothetical protein
MPRKSPRRSGKKSTEKPATTLPGTVNKIIESPHPSIPEKAEIAVEGADELYREIRIENTLTDDKGQEVKLKPGAEVDLTVEADPKATVPKADPDGTAAPDKSDQDKSQNRKAKGTGEG